MEIARVQGWEMVKVLFILVTIFSLILITIVYPYYFSLPFPSIFFFSFLGVSAMYCIHGKKGYEMKLGPTGMDSGK